LHAYLTSPGFEDALAAELPPPPRGAVAPRWPGVVTAATGVGDPVFALQVLPDATLVKGESVRALADAAVAPITSALAQDTPFALHAYVPDAQRYRSIAGRAALVREALLQRLGRARAAPWPSHHLVQAALVGRGSLLVSCSRPRPLGTGGFDLAPWPAGVAPVAEDRAAPSRAYGKLEEGLAWLGATPAPGQSCVDLGGAPGGWAWKALARGARVVAVDRAPLAAPALGHPALTSVIGDAFRYRPPAPVDWLLCDVICEPARTIDLVARWMERGWCRRVVATLKFKGKDGYGMLPAARARLAAAGWPFLRLKHLHRHHNEVAVLARAD
jgi:23S rRNA (cytidine2498-2'-O)-methyltransferase